MTEEKRVISVGPNRHFYLHGGEVAHAVKLKHDLNITVGKALVGPADIVITRPYIVDVTMCEIIEATHAIRQLSKSFCHTTGENKARIHIFAYMQKFKRFRVSKIFIFKTLILLFSKDALIDQMLQQMTHIWSIYKQNIYFK